MTDNVRDFFDALERAIPDLKDRRLICMARSGGARSLEYEYTLQGKVLRVEAKDICATLTIHGSVYDQGGNRRTRYAENTMLTSGLNHLDDAIKVVVDQLLAEFG